VGGSDDEFQEGEWLCKRASIFPTTWVRNLTTPGKKMDWTRVHAVSAKRCRSTSKHTRLEDIEGNVVVIIAFDYTHETVIEDVYDGNTSSKTPSRRRTTFASESGVSRRYSVVVQPSASDGSPIISGISMLGVGSN